MRNRERFDQTFFTRVTRLLLLCVFVGSLVAEERKLPSAVMLKRAPDRAQSGERAWPILDEE